MAGGCWFVDSKERRWVVGFEVMLVAYPSLFSANVSVSPLG